MSPNHSKLQRQIVMAHESHQRGDLGAAEKLYSLILSKKPDQFDACCGLGLIHLQHGKWSEGCRLLGQALKSQPRQALVLYNRGYALHQLKRFEEALSHYDESIAVDPDQPYVHENRGGVLAELNRFEDAVSSYSKAIELNPNNPATYSNRANALRELKRFDEALQDLEVALRLDPDCAEAYHNRSGVLIKLGQTQNAIDDLRRALALRPDFSDTHSNLIFALDLLDESSLEDLQSERHNWFERHGRKFSADIATYANTRDTARKLRIGYISADFCKHSACSAFGPIIRNHDLGRFEVYCYSATRIEDDVTESLRNAAYAWRAVRDLPDEELAELIRQDRIDILIDLSGHSSGNRLTALARKPAPIQITAWGYALGTGMDVMDFLIADRVSVSPETRHLYAEEILDMPTFSCWCPPDYSLAVSELPAKSVAKLTFGCLNRVEKISNSAIEAWGSILSLVPDARLLLKAPGLENARAGESILGRLSDCGVLPERVTLLGSTSHEEHLRTYQSVDISLDPFPHGGGVSTYESLYMGVPVVSLLGRKPAQRGAGAILNAVGMGAWVADTAAEYVRTAAFWAENRSALAVLRGELRERLLKSPVCDAVRYTRIAEDLFRQIWRSWCDRPVPNGKISECASLSAVNPVRQALLS